QRALRRGVGEHRRVGREERALRADQHERAAATALERRHNRAAQAHGADHVHAEDALPVLGRRRGDAAPDRVDRGDLHHRVDAAEALLGRGDEAGAAGGVADVEGVGEHALPARVELLRDRVELRAVARADRDVRAVAHRAVRDRAAEPRRPGPPPEALALAPARTLAPPPPPARRPSPGARARARAPPGGGARDGWTRGVFGIADSAPPADPRAMARRSATARPPAAATRRVALLVYPGFQALDATGPLEVFARANGVLAERHPRAPAAYELLLVAREAA